MRRSDRLVYLSGRIENLKYAEACRDREYATGILAEHGWGVLSPMRGTAVGDAGSTDVGGRVQPFTPAAMVLRDCNDIDDCRVVLVLTGSAPSFGTVFEWGIAAHEYSKPVVVVDPDHVSRNHPWCQYFSAYFADTLDEALEYIVRVLGDE